MTRTFKKISQSFTSYMWFFFQIIVTILYDQLTGKQVMEILTQEDCFLQYLTQALKQEPNTRWNYYHLCVLIHVATVVILNGEQMSYLRWKTSTYQSIYIYDALHDLVSFAQFKKREKSHGGVLLLVKLQSEAYIFTKSNSLSWVMKVPKKQVLKIIFDFCCIYCQAKLLTAMTFII